MKNMAPVQRKPRKPKTLTKKPSAVVQDKGWAKSDIDQTYTK